jgi:hypothetical protein
LLEWLVCHFTKGCLNTVLSKHQFFSKIKKNSWLFWKKDFLQNWCGQNILNRAMWSIMKVILWVLKGWWLSHVCGIAMNASTLWYLSNQEMGKTRISYLLSVERGNESRCLVFWSLGTLTGLIDRAQGLIA